MNPTTTRQSAEGMFFDIINRAENRFKQLQTLQSLIRWEEITEEQEQDLWNLFCAMKI